MVIYAIFKLSPENYLSFVRKYQKLNYDKEDSITLAVEEQEKNNEIANNSKKAGVDKPITCIFNEDIVKEKNNKSIEIYKKNIEVNIYRTCV